MTDTQPDPNIVSTAESLHRLALRYWSDGRTSDATRVAREAEALLRMHGVDGQVLDDVAATLRSLADEPGDPSDA
jgi:hypothetical protein